MEWYILPGRTVDVVSRARQDSPTAGLPTLRDRIDVISNNCKEQQQQLQTGLQDETGWNAIITKTCCFISFDGFRDRWQP